MKRFMMMIAVAMCAAMITGCGNKHVSLAKELGEALCSGDSNKVRAFFEKNVDEGFGEAAKYDRGLKKAAKEFRDANGSVTAQVLWEGEKDGEKGAIVSLTRGDATLYVIVEEGKGKKARIVSVTADKDIINAVLSGLK